MNPTPPVPTPPPPADAAVCLPDGRPVTYDIIAEYTQKSLRKEHITPDEYRALIEFVRQGRKSAAPAAKAAKTKTAAGPKKPAFDVNSLFNDESLFT
jgi:hypothetical protein